MARFTLPRDIYHGKGCLEELKNLKGKKAILVVGGGAMKRVIPAILLVADMIFFIKCVSSNYRFSYAIYGMISHLITVVLASAGAWVLTGYLEERIVFDTIALYAMPAIHALQCIAVLLTSIYAMNRGNVFRRVITVVSTVIFIFGIGLYGFFLSVEGFFGQGFFMGVRTLVYSYNEEGNYYIAEDVLDGRGKKVVIPAEFDGLPVGGVSCTLLGNNEISTVKLECSADVVFTNAKALSAPREDLQILAGRDTIDAFRKSLYALASEDVDTIQLANSIIPEGLKSDEVYITFQYSAESLEIVNGEIIPTWIAKSGTPFKLENHAENAEYIQHSNAENADDLYYCYTQQHGMIFRGFSNEDQTVVNISGVAINEIGRAHV